MVLPGCSGISRKPVEIEVTAKAQVVCAQPPAIDSLQLRTVEPRSVKDTLDVYWVGLTPRHYENFSKNMEDILAHIKQRKDVIKYYKKCIDRHNKPEEEGEDATRNP